MSMPMKKILRTIIIIMLSLVIIEVICVWWQYHRATVVIVNNSGKEISDLKVEMREGVQEIGLLPNGAKKYIRIYPKGESHFSVSFMTPEKRLICVPGSYVESTGGYKFTMIIAPDWSVSSELTLSRGCIIFPIYDYLHLR